MIWNDAITYHMDMDGIHVNEHHHMDHRDDDNNALERMNAFDGYGHICIGRLMSNI